jgi:hypothetical protein
LVRPIALILIFAYALIVCLIVYSDIGLERGTLWRDFNQDYLMVKAVAAGSNPYLPVSELAKQFGVESNSHLLRNPSPHPPTILPWLLPFSLLTMRAADLTWLALCLFGGYISCFLTIKVFAPEWRQKPLGSLMLFFAILLTAPVKEDLQLGQFSLIQLPLLLLGYKSIAQNEKTLGGMLLGLLVTIKLFLWPLLFFFGLKKEWKIVGAAAVIILLQSVLAAFVIGSEGFISYFTVAIPSTLVDFANHPVNYSFSSMFSSIFRANTIANPQSIAGTLFWCDRLTWLIFFSIVMKKSVSSNLCTAFWSVVAASIVLSPVAWPHYAILLLPVLFLTSLQVVRATGKQPYAPWMLALLLPLFIPGASGSEFLRALIDAGRFVAMEAQYHVFSPPIQFLLTLPTLSIACFALLFKVENLPPEPNP